MSQKTLSTLRCFWIPAHFGANAPLTAVWVQAPHCASKVRRTAATSQSEGDSWASAA
jgi:hypothetical protein